MPIRSYSYISRLLVAVHPTGISILEILPNALKRVWGFPFRIITMSISFYSNKYSFCLPHSLIEPPPPQKFTIWLPIIIIFLQTNEQYPTWLFLPTPSLSTTKRTADSRLGCTIHGYKHLRRRSHPRGQHVLPAPSDVIIPPSAHPIPSRKAGSVGRVGAT